MRTTESFLSSSGFLEIAINTVVWADRGLVVVVRLILGLLFALLLNSKFMQVVRLTTIARLILLVPWATPPVVAVIAWRWLFDPNHGAVNSLLLSTGLISDPVAFLANLLTVWPSLVTIIVWNTTPLVAVSLLAALQAIPEELNEAAAIDGATRWQQFRFVTLPYLMPTLSVLGLMSVIWTFNNFVYVWLATGRRARHLYQCSCHRDLYQGLHRLTHRFTALRSESSWRSSWRCSGHFISGFSDCMTCRRK